MGRKSTIPSIHTNPPGTKNQLTQLALDGRITDPDFEWSWAGVTTERTIKIIPKWSGSGYSAIRIPYFVVDSSDNDRPSITQNIHLEPNEWTIDTSVNTINLVTKIGGVIDGVVGSNPYTLASLDLLVWAFFDHFDSENVIFKGFGATHRPFSAYTTHNNGAKGSTTTFTLAGTGINRGRLFRPGSRVMIREGLTIDTGAGFGSGGSRYNQGIVISVTNTSIVVLLDNNTLGGAPGTNLTAATAGTIIQIDKFEPRIAGSDSIYPGSGTEYSYAYMGNVRINSSNNIFTARKRGEVYFFQDELSLFTQTGVTATTTWNRMLGRYVPNHASIIEINGDLEATTLSGTNNRLLVRASTVTTDELAEFATPCATTANSPERNTDEVACKRVDQSVEIQIVRAAGTTLTGNVYVRGYVETQF